MKKVKHTSTHSKQIINDGFTLIELLGVIILLAIIALIATPIILNVVNDAQESADMTTAQLIVSSGHNYYAASLFDEAKKMKIDNLADVYNEIEMTNKPTTGQLYVNNNDQVAIAVIINNKCYKKNFIGDIEVIGTSECDLGFIGQDEIAPTISQEVINTSANSNDWYKEDLYIKVSVTDNESGVAGYKRCMGTSECTPDNTIYNVSNQIYINTESDSNYVCVIGIDNYGNESDKECIIYKLDKTAPTIEGVGDLTVQLNEQVDLSENVIYNDVLSGIDGELLINPSTVDTSTVGTKPVTYSISDKAGNIREVIRNIIVDAEAPTITFNPVDSSAINSNGWAKSNFYLRATITDNSGSGIASASSCTTNSSSECEPIASFTGTTKDFYIESEGSNRACISVTDNNNKTTKICSDTYKLDKTVPTAGTATFAGTLGSNDWYTTDVTVNILDGSDNLSGHDSTTSSVSSITANTTETIVTITTTDLAGNSATRDYTIKVDKDSPTLTAKDGTVEITEGDSNDVSNYFNINYSVSGGSINCTPTNTSGLGVGSQTLSCTATGGNGKTVTATKEITVKSSVTTISSVVLERFPELATNGNGCVTPGTNNGSYMGGCYMSGSHNDNYVWYSGFLWRIMGINADGTIRMITNEDVTATPYHNSSANWDSSYVKKWLNEYFYNRLNDPSIITTQTWCNSTTTSATARTTCTNNLSSQTAKIGLLTLDEYLLSGGRNNYLDIWQSQLTATPYDSSSVWYIDDNGYVDSETVDYSTYGVRPVINISPDVVITGGDGVINTNWNNESGPYILNEDKSTNTTGKLSENSTNGEYVLLAGKKYRIVDYDSNGNTKLILDGYYEENGEVFEMEYGSNNVFSTSSGIGRKLNGDVLNWLVPTTTDRNKLVTYTWYQNTFNYGDSYEVSLNETSPYRTTSAMVGTIRIGELLAAQPDSIITNGYTMSDEWSLYGYWTAMPFTYYGDNATLWIIFEESELSDGPASNILALRPVIVVNSNVNITGGTGTWSNPYQI